MTDRRSLYAVLLAAALLSGCGGQGGSARPGVSPSAPSSTPAPTPTGQEPPAPRQVRIEAIDLEEQLIDLALEESGELEVPKDPARAGWFSGGGRPGGPGPTVIVGHLDSRTGPAVFARLIELRPGDTIVVTTADDTETGYVVRKVQDFRTDELPIADVFGATADDELRLITCTGSFDRSIGRYTENRVAFATPG